MPMTHTYEELKKKTIAELREIAKEIQHEAVQGYTQLNKEHLLPAVCKALGIDTHAHHAAALAEKAAVKATMREINARRPRLSRAVITTCSPAPPAVPSAEPHAPHGSQALGRELNGVRRIASAGARGEDRSAPGRPRIISDTGRSSRQGFKESSAQSKGKSNVRHDAQRCIGPGTPCRWRMPASVARTSSIQQLARRHGYSTPQDMLTGV